MSTHEELTDAVVGIWTFMTDYARANDAVPSVRAIAKGTNRSIRKTRRLITLMEEIGMIRRTIHGFAVPKETTHS